MNCTRSTLHLINTHIHNHTTPAAPSTHLQQGYNVNGTTIISGMIGLRFNHGHVCGMIRWQHNHICRVMS